MRRTGPSTWKHRIVSHMDRRCWLSSSVSHIVFLSLRESRIQLSLPSVSVLTFLRIISFAVAVALTCFTITANIDRRVQLPVYGVTWCFVVVLLFGPHIIRGERGLVGALRSLSMPFRTLASLSLRVKWPEKETIEEIEMGIGPEVVGDGPSTDLADLNFGRGVSTKRRTWLSGLKAPVIVIERRTQGYDEEPAADSGMTLFAPRVATSIRRRAD